MQGLSSVVGWGLVGVWVMWANSGFEGHLLQIKPSPWVFSSIRMCFPFPLYIRAAGSRKPEAGSRKKAKPMQVHQSL